MDLLRYLSDFLSGRINSISSVVLQQMQDAIVLNQADLKKHATRIMEENADSDFRAELGFMEITDYFVRIAESCLKVHRQLAGFGN